MENIQYLPLPYDIDDTVYYMEKVDEVGGHPQYKIINGKCIVFGYYNFYCCRCNGWKIRLHTNRNKYKYAEYNLDVISCGYIVFGRRKQAEERIRELCGSVVE